ncbi:MAG: NAD(+) diphosphatase [Parachlamydiaceae bacterium]|nr:NAD(+) diphosphatase [Parachlamydiaceae bacterium]
MSLKTIPFELPDFFIDRIQPDLKNAQIDFWFIFINSKLLIDQNTLKPYQLKDISLKHKIFIGTFKGLNMYVGEACSEGLPSHTFLQDLQQLYGKMDDALFALAGRAAQLLLWERTHQFCGQCGGRTSERINERAKICLTCNLLTFPKICPVMMVLIKKGNEILLARGVNFPAAFYSALAGFVDAGETLEHCIKREVFEEVGLYVENFQYFGSQSWPFPNSLMIAFTCEWKSGEIKIDPSEILDAQWFKKEDLPSLPPPFSISRILIDHVLTNLETPH